MARKNAAREKQKSVENVESQADSSKKTRDKQKSIDKVGSQTESAKKHASIVETRKISKRDLAEAADIWEKHGGEERERFFATLDADLGQILRSLGRAKDLSKVVEAEKKMRIAALASLHRHSYAAGAKHTDLRRAFQLSKQATQFIQSVVDLLTDRQPSLVPSAQKLAADVQSWSRHIASVFGDAKEAGPKVVPTRGKTAPGRLRSLDAFMCRYMSETLPSIANPGMIVVDLGYGEVAVTTIELARMLWRTWPDVHIIGVESDRNRAEKAKENWMNQTPVDLGVIGPKLTCRGRWTCSMEGRMEFRHGGFLMPLADAERPQLCCVKAMNVLRQYESLQECRNAHRTIMSQLAENGLLFEGTSDPTGNVVTSYVLRASGNGEFVVEGLFFALNLRAQARRGGLSVDLESDDLPQLLFKRNVAKFELFLEHWRAAVAATDGSRGVKQHFLAAGRRLSEELPKEIGEVVIRSQWLRRGWLFLKNPAEMA